MRLRYKPIIFFFIIALFSISIYLLTSCKMIRCGFPLDDAWIHQTYARNLGLSGEWAYQSGLPSAGSTSPLWTFLLAAGYALGINPLVWTYGLGWLLLGCIGILGWLLSGYFTGDGKRSVLVAVLLIFEWHLVWSAVSGMEILVLGLLAMAVLGLLLGQKPKWLVIGILVGLSVWVRPDGVTLAGPVLLVILSTSKTLRQGLSTVSLFCLGFFMVAGPYLGFNYWLSGTLWPNTYYAKQAEYAILRQGNFLNNLTNLLKQPLWGAGLVVLPGWLLGIWKGWKERSWPVLAGAAWVIGFIFVYAWRLPVVYHHGRYVMPVLPVFLTWGMASMVDWIKLKPSGMLQRVLKRSWLVSLAAVTAIYWVMGAGAYGGEVGFIETEMVEAAVWIQENTPNEARIAAHDIGALGYFSNRPLLDLAGLVTPDVIPFIRDEARLASWLTDEDADYLVTFPGWYPQMVQGLELIHQSQGEFAPGQGGENLAVYRWNKATP